MHSTVKPCSPTQFERNVATLIPLPSPPPIKHFKESQHFKTHTHIPFFVCFFASFLLLLFKIGIIHSHTCFWNLCSKLKWWERKEQGWMLRKRAGEGESFRMITSDLIFALKTLFEFSLPSPSEKIRLSSVTWSLAESYWLKSVCRHAFCTRRNKKKDVHRERGRDKRLMNLALPQASIKIIFTVILPPLQWAKCMHSGLMCKVHHFHFFILDKLENG